MRKLTLATAAAVAGAVATPAGAAGLDVWVVIPPPSGAGDPRHAPPRPRGAALPAPRRPPPT